jgi:succinate dehydrogenase / fumarate reductase flavoprotein subunit
MWTNHNLAYTRALGDMIRLAEVIVAGSIERRESRGSHFRTDFPERDDKQFLASTIAEYDEARDCPRLSFETVETGLVKPRARTYGKVEKKVAKKPVATAG